MYQLYPINVKTTILLFTNEEKKHNGNLNTIDRDE